MNTLDTKALKILHSYDILHPENMPSDEFSYAKQHGLMFDDEHETHDEVIKKCFNAYAGCEKEHFTNLFLASLSSNRLDYRSGLSAYAIMQTFPNHVFETINDYDCKICCETPELNIDFNMINMFRFFCGGIAGVNASCLYFFLNEHKKLINIYPTLLDFKLFRMIMDVILSVDEKATPTILQKEIKKISCFKATKEQIQYFLETLGYCSILETSTHKGFLFQYTNLGIPPRKTHSSDWKYPVDFWKGKDGINHYAYEFWFGQYKELKL